MCYKSPFVLRLEHTELSNTLLIPEREIILQHKESVTVVIMYSSNNETQNLFQKHRIGSAEKQIYIFCPCITLSKRFKVVHRKEGTLRHKYIQHGRMKEDFGWGRGVDIH